MLCWLAVALILWPCCASGQSRDERAVRAAYVFNLIKYVEWPSATNELTIVFIGDASTGEVMAKMLSGRTADARVIRVVLSPTDEDLRKCSLLYVAQSQPGDIRKTLDAVKGRNVVTVGEAAPFARAGGMVGLVNTGDHIQIEVNLEAAQHAGIRISSRVLDLALIVHTDQNGGN